MLWATHGDVPFLMCWKQYPCRRGGPETPGEVDLNLLACNPTIQRQSRPETPGEVDLNLLAILPYNAKVDPGIPHRQTQVYLVGTGTATFFKKTIYDIGTKILFGALMSHKPIKIGR